MTVQHLDCHMLLPHDWLASLDRAGCLQSHWGTDRVAAFWRAQKANNPKLFQNPVTEVKDFDKVFIPLLLHGDGARYGERTSVMVYTVRSISSLLSVNDSQLLLAAVPKGAGQLVPQTHGMQFGGISYGLFKLLLKAGTPSSHSMASHLHRGH